MGSRNQEIRLKGTPICAGVAIGKAFFFTFDDDIVPEFSIAPNEIEDEIERYQRALKRSRQDIVRLQKQLEVEGGLEGVAILDTHLQMMQDPVITTNIEDSIRETKKNTEYIFQMVIREYEEKFNKISDKFFRERFRDIQDISRRIMRHLRDSVRISLADIPNNSVVFAQELSPSDTAEAKSSRIGAFVTEAGGETSHAAIMAKAKGIPYVGSVSFEGFENIKNAQVIVDGRSGEVIVHPNKETLSYYKDLQKQIKVRYKGLQEAGALVAETIDGYRVSLSANIEMLEEIDMLHQYGGKGVGLFRSEYIFLSRESFPSEEEQFEAYKSIVVRMKGLPVIIRSFDIGGDKVKDHHRIRNEVNPFLGCRAIRFMLKERDLFKEQLRAILRAGAFGNVNLMFPMISGLPELLQAKALVEEVKDDLRKEGIPYGEDVKIGCMIEVPSAAITCDTLAKECDFLSIGTNDLVQYSLAVDRGNQAMSYLYTPTDPSVIRLIKMIVTAGNRNDITVSICGEVAADPTFTALLLGLGVHELSVAPRYIPLVKNAIRNANIVEASQLAERVLSVPTADEVQQILIDEYRKNVEEEALEPMVIS